MPGAASVKFSKIVVVESLEVGEPRTGEVLSQFLAGLPDVQALDFPVEYRTCESFREFLDLVDSLAIEAIKHGHVPLLHVECHGDKDHGLEFGNGSTLAWPDLSVALVELNRATRFNLVAVFAACYGGYFLSRLSSVEPAPCYAMIAPTDTVDPSEILATFREFYSVLFSQRDITIAVNAIARKKLTEGHWFGEHAESWFERLTMGYVENYCTKAAMRDRSKRMYRTLLRDGTRLSVGSLKRQLVQTNRTNLLENHFDRYFMTDSISENTGRFSAVRSRMKQRIASLRATGRYLV